MLGNPLLVTQHLLGATKWIVHSDNNIVGLHQVRAAHQRFKGTERDEIAAKGHGHAVITHHYRQIEGQWKLAGLRPHVHWNEHDFEKVFATKSTP